MTEDDVKSLVAEYIEDDKEVELTVRAVKFVSDRMGLAQSVCDRLFGANVVDVEDVYSMYDYLNREMSAQVLLMAGERAVSTLEAANARTKPDDELN